MTTKRAFFLWMRRLHAFAGAALSLVFFVIAASGTLLVLKPDYVRLTIPEARAAADLSPEALGGAMDAAHDLFGAGQVRAMIFASDELALHKVYLRDGGAYLSAEGELVTRWGKNGRFDEWLFDLHHHLLAGDRGEFLTGIVGLCTLLLVIGGLVAYWPMRRGVKRGLRADDLGRAHMRSFHRNLGLLSALPALILVVTGTGLVFHQTTKTLLGAPPVDRAPIVVDSPEVASWATVVASSADAVPGAVPRLAVPPRGEGPAVIRLRQVGEWHPNGRTVASIDPSSAVLLRLDDAQAAPVGERVFNGFYPLHAARVGGPAVTVLTFAGGLALTLLTAAGLVSFLQRPELRLRGLGAGPRLDLKKAR